MEVDHAASLKLQDRVRHVSSVEEVFRLFAPSQGSLARGRDLRGPSIDAANEESEPHTLIMLGQFFERHSRSSFSIHAIDMYVIKEIVFNQVF
jgi:hypothetical protein